MMTFDGIQLFAAPFSSFVCDKKSGAYKLSSKGLLVQIDFVRNTLVVSTPSNLYVSPLTPANGAEVLLHMGKHSAVETIPLTATKSGYYFQRP
jgi:hypothetical protein